jgi:hypothetical protein
MPFAVALTRGSASAVVSGEPRPAERSEIPLDKLETMHGDGGSRTHKGFRPAVFETAASAVPPHPRDAESSPVLGLSSGFSAVSAGGVLDPCGPVWTREVVARVARIVART